MKAATNCGSSHLFLEPIEYASENARPAKAVYLSDASPETKWLAYQSWNPKQWVLRSEGRHANAHQFLPSKHSRDLSISLGAHVWVIVLYEVRRQALEPILVDFEPGNHKLSVVRLSLQAWQGLHGKPPLLWRTPTSMAKIWLVGFHVYYFTIGHRQFHYFLNRTCGRVLANIVNRIYNLSFSNTDKSASSLAQNTHIHKAWPISRVSGRSRYPRSTPMLIYQLFIFMCMKWISMLTVSLKKRMSPSKVARSMSWTLSKSKS